MTLKPQVNEYFLFKTIRDPVQPRINRQVTDPGLRDAIIQLDEEGSAGNG